MRGVVEIFAGAIPGMVSLAGDVASGVDQFDLLAQGVVVHLIEVAKFAQGLIVDVPMGIREKGRN